MEGADEILQVGLLHPLEPSHSCADGYVKASGGVGGRESSPGPFLNFSKARLPSPSVSQISDHVSADLSWEFGTRGLEIPALASGIQERAVPEPRRFLSTLDPQPQAAFSL